MVEPLAETGVNLDRGMLIGQPSKLNTSKQRCVGDYSKGDSSCHNLSLRCLVGHPWCVMHYLRLLRTFVYIVCLGISRQKTSSIHYEFSPHSSARVLDFIFNIQRLTLYKKYWSWRERHKTVADAYRRVHVWRTAPFGARVILMRGRSLLRTRTPHL